MVIKMSMELNWNNENGEGEENVSSGECDVAVQKFL